MKDKMRTAMFGLLMAMALALGACSVNIERNPDGSLTVETTMTEESLQSEIRAGIADPLVRDLAVDLRGGYIFVTGERQRLHGDETDTLSFRLDLGASDGHLTAVVSEAKLNDVPIEAERVALWNERLATRLERAGRRNANSSLQAVTIGADDITMVWRVETWRSRGG